MVSSRSPCRVDKPTDCRGKWTTRNRGIAKTTHQIQKPCRVKRTEVFEANQVESVANIPTAQMRSYIKRKHQNQRSYTQAGIAPARHGLRSSKRLEIQRICEMAKSKKKTNYAPKPELDIVTRTVELLPTICNSSHPSSKLAFMISLNLAPRREIIQAPFVSLSRVSLRAVDTHGTAGTTTGLGLGAIQPVASVTVMNSAEEGPISFEIKVTLEGGQHMQTKDDVDLKPSFDTSESESKKTFDECSYLELKPVICGLKKTFFPKTNDSSQRLSSQVHYHHYVVKQDFPDEKELVYSASYDMARLAVSCNEKVSKAKI